MNLRLSPKDKRSFDRFCKQHHLKAREALGLLLDHVTGDDEHLRPLLQERAAYGQECERLRTRLADSQTEHLPGQEQRVLDYLYFLRTGFSDYLQQIVLMPKGEPLLACSYKRFKSESGLHPDYPETEGFLVIQAVAMLWGRNKARFIVGQGPAGEYLKLRYYPKPLYMGHLVWEYPAGTRWLLGCRRAADGTMEIAAAFPLPPRMVSQNETATPAEAERRPSLNDQIANAMKQL